MRTRLIAVLGVVAVLAASCAQDNQRLAFGNVPEAVDGNVVTLPVEVEGIDIVAADGESGTASGHFHVFVDRDPAGVGEVVPMERGIVHSAENPVRVYGLEPGRHTFTIVAGDGTHTRFGEDLIDYREVDVRGPGVQGEAPATIDEGEELTIQLHAQGVDIRAADGDTSGESGHFHVFVDPDDPPQPGDVVPVEMEGIYHTAESFLTIEGLERGQHTIWVAIGDGTHTLLDPAVMDRLTVTVG